MVVSPPLHVKRVFILFLLASWLRAGDCAEEAPVLLEKARGLEPEAGCIFGRFKVHVAPLDLKVSTRFVMTLKSESGEERALPFSPSSSVETFSIKPGRWAFARMGSYYGSQYRDAPMPLTRPVYLEIEPGRCHYLGDFAAIISLKQLQSKQDRFWSITPYSWGLASAEERFESARSALDAGAFPADRLDSRFARGALPLPE